MRVAIATTQVPFVRGGAEMLADNLLHAIRAAGHEAEIVSLPFKWYPPDRVPDHMLAARLLRADWADRVIGLKFPAYLMAHASKRLWVLHQHRSAYDLWDAPFCELRQAPDGAHVRQTVRAADAAAFDACEAIYTISAVVSARLHRDNGVDAPPLYHPPPRAERLHSGEYGDYFLFPGRVNESKRQHLMIEALALARSAVRVCFIGATDAPHYAAALQARCAALGILDRVSWRGAVTNAEREALYAGCLAVAFIPQDEDYGYVTLEAMLCAKAVLTTDDAGGPLEFVGNGENGLVCPAHPQAIAEAMDRLWESRALAYRWGRAGQERYAALGLGWSSVVERLLH